MSERVEQLYVVQRKDSTRAGAVLADAFHEDPLWRAIFGEDSTRALRVAAFETPIVYALKYGEVWATSAALEGIIAWLPGLYANMTIWRMLRSGAIFTSIPMGLKFGRKLEAIFRLLERDRMEHMKSTPFIYLEVLGVAPVSQGQGLGGRLLRALIEKSDQMSLPIYLETETERNIGMYARFGFRVLTEITLPVLNLPMWEMVREPKV